MAGPRYIAVKATGAVLDKGAYSDTILDILLSRDRTISSEDRALVTELTYGVLRNITRIDYILSRFSKKKLQTLDREVLHILRVALYQVIFSERIPPYAAVSEAVKLASAFGKGSASSFINGVLRAALRGMDGVKYPDYDSDPISFISIYYSLPEWLTRFFVEFFGVKKAKSIAKNGVQRPPVTLRANSLKITRDGLIEKLNEMGLSVTKGIFSPHGILASGGGALYKGELYAQGYFSLQDESSQMVSVITGIEPGMDVLDLCSAPGIKGTYLGELMGNRGRVISVEKNVKRARLIRENRERLGIDGLDVILADAGSLPIGNDIKFDRVLVDPPCSGLGTIRRNPEIKWRLEKGDIPGLIGLQKRILYEGARFVKRGGKLVYGVCTINPAEGRDLVYEFLTSHPDFSLDDISSGLDESCLRFISDDAFFTPPYLFDTDNWKTPDGFFAARLKRK